MTDTPDNTALITEAQRRTRIATRCLFPGFLLFIPLIFSVIYANSALKMWKEIDKNSSSILRLQGTRIAAVCLGIFYLVSFIMDASHPGAGAPSSPQQAAPSASTPVSIGRTNAALDEIKARALKMAKKGVERGDIKGVSIAPLPGVDGIAYEVVVICNAHDGYNNKTTRRMILGDALGVFQRINEDEDLKTIHRYTFRAKHAMMDAYGNQSEGVIAELMLNKSTADKINWDNFSVEQLANLLKLSDNSIWWHRDLLN
ncbi:MAG: hypothetical protein JW942_04670 [Opitutales bacterium]|nr:hypothetical protein [Opitutales bacterium]